MRRTFLIALVVLGCVGSARAALTFTIPVVRVVQSPTLHAIPFDYTFQIDNLPVWSIEGVDIADSGTPFRLDSSTAAGYGLDWAALVSGVETSGIFDITTDYEQAGSNVEFWRQNQVNIPGSLLTLNWIESEFVIAPRSNGGPGTLWSVTNTMRLNVTGVPEPPSLSLLALCGLCAHIRRRPTSRAGN